MSSNISQTKNNEDSEVMVRQVNLAAAFHDHISCTKISQQSITTSNFGLQTSVAAINDPQKGSISSMGSEVSVAFESDHMYATESKSTKDSNSLSINGLIRTIGLSEERNQISKLTEMILGQLDLIQHQQEQLLKKDRQLQGLKQDREALCLRLEKMEKRIAVLTTKVSTNVNNNSICVNNRNNNQNNSTETDCDQSGSDTIIEDTNSGVGLFTDPTVFTKLYSNTSSVNSNVNNKHSICGNVSKANQLNITSNTTNSIKIKTESQVKNEFDKTIITTAKTTTSSASARKRDKRHTEVSTIIAPTSTGAKKRRKGSNSCVANTNDVKKEMTNSKETSSDSLSTLSTSQSNKTYSNVNNIKKPIAKQKCETPLRLDKTHRTSSATNCRTSSVTRDVLTTTKPYSIVVNSDYLPLELSINDSKANDLLESKTNNSITETKLNEQKSYEEIEVPNWRLHPVSSCYSLEGTENLDDDVFNRRHLKLENDERRRKRWDIQRLREHRYNEKLRTGRYYNSSLGNCFIEKPSDLKDLKKKNSEFVSFYPNIRNLQAIEVTEKIPFIAFGHSIPKLTEKCFSLPWNPIEVKPQTTSKAKNTPQKKN